MKVRIVCAGTFDRLHTGHVEYLKHAKALAENAELVVIVARDVNSERIKHKKPEHDEETRLRRVQEFDFVDEAVLGGQDSSRVIDFLAMLKPDVVALGHDQWAKEEWVATSLKEKGLDVKVFRMPEFEKKYLD